MDGIESRSGSEVGWGHVGLREGNSNSGGVRGALEEFEVKIVLR